MNSKVGTQRKWIIKIFTIDKFIMILSNTVIKFYGILGKVIIFPTFKK